MMLVPPLTADHGLLLHNCALKNNLIEDHLLIEDHGLLFHNSHRVKIKIEIARKWQMDEIKLN